MTLIGCNPDEMDRLSGRFRSTASHIEADLDTLERQIGGLPWEGSDANEFRTVWARIRRETAGATVDSLKRLERDVARNAEAQRRVSAGLGNTVGHTKSFGEAPGTFPTPPKDGSPAAVKQWWDSLTYAQRQELITRHPEMIGNLDGVPPKVRYQANHNRIEQLLATEADPNGPLHKRFGPFLNENRQIMLFDPSGDGKLAEVFGDIETADHLGVSIPGMGSGIDNFDAGVRKDAMALWGNDPHTAVIAWTGYDAPKGLVNPLKPGGVSQDVAAIVEVADDGLATDGGRQLHTFVDGLRQYSDKPLTAVGHSYGSLTLGKALADGMKVDNAIFIGSPGAGVDNVGDFPDGAAKHYYSMAIDGDPVANLERFGERPTDAQFGATILDTDDPGNKFFSHSEYYNEGSTQLKNLSSVVTGGQPTVHSQSIEERAAGVVDNAGDALNSGIDSFQDHVNLGPVDGVVDAAQVGIENVDNAADIVIDGAEAAVSWVWNQIK